jgi:aflatoxin B1 aldehyde reductase
MYNNLFNRPAYLESLEKWQKAAEAAGCTRAELAYRWVAYDSVLDPKHGDGIIIGATNLDQLSETLEWLKKGPVGPAASALVDEVWKTVEHEAQLDNFNK